MKKSDIAKLGVLSGRLNRLASELGKISKRAGKHEKGLSYSQADILAIVGRIDEIRSEAAIENL